jgi:heme-degrading monooxygenase HmoA
VEVVVPRMASLPGFTGGHVLVDQDTGDVLTTTFWRSLRDLEASARAAAHASSAAEVLSEGGLTRDLRTCDVLALLPAPTVSHPHLLPPRSAGSGPGAAS